MYVYVCVYVCMCVCMYMYVCTMCIHSTIVRVSSPGACPCRDGATCCNDQCFAGNCTCCPDNQCYLPFGSECCLGGGACQPNEDCCTNSAGSSWCCENEDFVCCPLLWYATPSNGPDRQTYRQTDRQVKNKTYPPAIGIRNYIISQI